jgi:hypothetical protein
LALQKKHIGKIICSQILELSVVKSPCLMGVLSPSIPSLSGIYAKQGNFIKSQYEMLNSAFNAQGSRVIIVVVHVKMSQ